MSENKLSYKEALSALDKRFGKGYVTTGGSYEECERISTGVFALDFAIGGGMPIHKIMTIAGEYSSGKTTVALLTAAEFQRAKKKVAYIDTDHGLDPEWATKLGVDMKKMDVFQADYIEQVSDTIETLLLTDEVGLIIFDSVANTPSKAELEESCEKDSYGGIGKPMARMMRKITKRLQHTEASVIVINQLRDKIGGYGNTEYLPGGRALKYQSDIIVWLRPNEWIGSQDNPVGKVSKFRINKNRTAPPLKTGQFGIYFEGKVDNEGAIVDEALAKGICGKAGAWFYYKNEKDKTQGRDNFVKKLVESGEIEEIKNKVLGKA